MTETIWFVFIWRNPGLSGAFHGRGSYDPMQPGIHLPHNPSLPVPLPPLCLSTRITPPSWSLPSLRPSLPSLPSLSLSSGINRRGSIMNKWCYHLSSQINSALKALATQRVLLNSVFCKLKNTFFTFPVNPYRQHSMFIYSLCYSYHCHFPSRFQQSHHKSSHLFRVVKSFK